MTENTSPLISILVATYNGEKFILDQLESLYNQTYSNKELIIVDDCSTDNTVKIIENWSTNKSNVKLYTFKENLGYLKNFERGIKLCEGNYISLCDQDDIWDIEKTYKLYQKIGINDLAYCNSSFVDEDLKNLNKSFKDKSNMLSSNDPLNYLIRNNISGHALLFKKDLLVSNFKFPEFITHDRWLAFLASSRNGTVFLDESLVKYRIHNNNSLGGKKRIKKNKKTQKIEAASKIKSLCEILPNNFQNEKKGLETVYLSYVNNNVINRFKRCIFFLKNYNRILAIPKKTKAKKIFYALSMFNKIR